MFTSSSYTIRYMSIYISEDDQMKRPSRIAKMWYALYPTTLKPVEHKFRVV
jgi:hypothetical protein